MSFAAFGLTTRPLLRTAQLPTVGFGGNNMLVGKASADFINSGGMRHRINFDPSIRVSKGGRSTGRGLGTVKRTPGHTCIRDWPEIWSLCAAATRIKMMPAFFSRETKRVDMQTSLVKGLSPRGF